MHISAVSILVCGVWCVRDMSCDQGEPIEAAVGTLFDDVGTSGDICRPLLLVPGPQVDRRTLAYEHIWS